MIMIEAISAREVYWKAMRDVCADLRDARRMGFDDRRWIIARRRTLASFYDRWCAAYKHIKEFNNDQ